MTRNEIIEKVNSLLSEEFEVDSTLFNPTFTDLYDYIESHLPNNE